MVRRWSHLNYININLYVNPLMVTQPILNIYRLLTFKSTTYYWDELYFDNTTLIKRRSYLRRKHLNTLTYYQVLLNFWAREYLSIRRYSRALFQLNLHKYNYVSQNLFLYTNLNVEGVLGYEQYATTSFSKKFFKMSAFYTNKLSFVWQNFSNYYIIISSHTPLQKLFNEEVFRPIVGQQLLNYQYSKSLFSVRLLLSSVLTSLLMHIYVQFYRTMILLVINTF